MRILRTGGEFEHFKVLIVINWYREIFFLNGMIIALMNSGEMLGMDSRKQRVKAINAKREVLTSVIESLILL